MPAEWKRRTDDQDGGLLDTKRIELPRCSDTVNGTHEVIVGYIFEPDEGAKKRLVLENCPSKYGNPAQKHYITVNREHDGNYTYARARQGPPDELDFFGKSD